MQDSQRLCLSFVEVGCNTNHSSVLCRPTKALCKVIVLEPPPQNNKKEINLKWFQIKFCYRILVTNLALKQMGVIQTTTKSCHFCQREKDTIFHYRWECVHPWAFQADFVKCLKESATTVLNWLLIPLSSCSAIAKLARRIYRFWFHFLADQILCV